MPIAQKTRFDLAQNLSLSAGIASRYSQAVFELAREEGQLNALSEDVTRIREAFEGSEDFQTLVSSPVYTREDATRAMLALSERMGLGRNFANTLALMASKRRLFTLPQLLDRIDRMIDEENGVAEAEVVTARKLTAGELGRVRGVLEDKTDRDIRLAEKVDPDLIGGMVVRLGSRLVDSSIRTKLSNMRSILREVE